MRKTHGKSRAFLWRSLRLILPLAALVLLSTVFLVSRSVDPQRAIELAEIDITEITREPRIGTARVAGITQEKTALLIESNTIRSITDLQSDEALHLELDNPVGELQFPAQRTVFFQSDAGEVDVARDRLVMRGDVILQTSDGFDLRMPQLVSALQTTLVTGTGGVAGEGPPGSLTADALELRANPETPDGYLLAFTGNVRLIYQPED